MMAHRVRRAEPPAGPRSQSSSGARAVLARADPGQHLVVQVPVGGERVAAPGPGRAVQGGEPPAGLGDDGHQRRHVVDGQLRLGRDVDGALGHEHVGPEVAVRAGAPAVVGQPEELLIAADLAPRADARVRHRRVGEGGHLGHRHALGAGQAPPGPGAGAARGPPAAVQRRRGDQAEHRLALVHQRDEGGPHRHAPDEVLGAVDRVDHPASRAVAGGVELLALDGVAGAGALELVPDELLGRPVGVGHRAEVGLGLHHQVLGAEAGDGQTLDRIGQDVGEAQVVVIGGHRPHGSPCRAPTA